MKIKDLLKKLVDKKFRVYVSGEYERTTDFLGLMSLLANFSSFFSYANREKRSILKGAERGGEIYIDANISVRVNL